MSIPGMSFPSTFKNLMIIIIISIQVLPNTYFETSLWEGSSSKPSSEVFPWPFFFSIGLSKLFKSLNRLSLFSLFSWDSLISSTLSSASILFSFSLFLFWILFVGKFNFFMIGTSNFFSSSWVFWFPVLFRLSLDKSIGGRIFLAFELFYEDLK